MNHVRWKTRLCMKQIKTKICMIFKRLLKLINILLIMGCFSKPKWASKRLAQWNMLPTDSLAAVFHIKYEHSYPSEQSGSGFNPYAAVAAMGTPHSQVFLCMNTFLSQIPVQRKYDHNEISGTAALRSQFWWESHTFPQAAKPYPKLPVQQQGI